MKTQKVFLFLTAFAIALLSISGCSDENPVAPIASKKTVEKGMPGKSEASPVLVDPAPVPLYRYWSPSQSDHHYTINWYELQYGGSGYNFEMIAGRVLPLGNYAGRSDIRPVYRLYKWGDHLFTANYNEIAYAQAAGYQYEMIGFYIYVVQKPGTIPLYRFWWGSGTDHFYTTNMAEGTGNGMTLEGIIGYVIPGDTNP